MNTNPIVVQERMSIDNTDWIHSQVQKKKQQSEPDDLIDAHQDGIMKGITRHERVLQAALNENLIKIFEISEKYFHEVKNNLSPKNMYIKVHNITCYESLIIVNKKKYLNRSQRAEAYEKMRDINNLIKSEIFRISFSFKTESENLNEDSIISDGFFFKYAPKSRKTQ